MSVETLPIRTPVSSWNPSEIDPDVTYQVVVVVVDVVDVVLVDFVVAVDVFVDVVVADDSAAIITTTIVLFPPPPTECRADPQTSRSAHNQNILRLWLLPN